jgi:hypothetical protein
LRKEGDISRLRKEEDINTVDGKRKRTRVD